MLELKDLVPLVTSAIGVAGGYVVAAYSVRKSHATAVEREALAARRTEVRANAERLRERLEELVHGVEDASQRVTLGSINVLSNAGMPDGLPVKAVQTHELLELLVRPATLQRLYFPTLEGPMRALTMTLIDTQSVVSRFASKPPEVQQVREVADEYAAKLKRQMDLLGEVSRALYAQCRVLLAGFDAR